MNRNELHPDLNREFIEDLGSGVEQVDHAKCQNMWFVVPPSPPRNLPGGLSLKAVTEASAIIAAQPNIADATELDRLVSYLFLRKEAVESSRMEGTLSTIDQVLTPGEVFDDWKAKSEGASVRGYAHALDEELKRETSEGLAIFTVDLASRLHKEIMARDPKFRGIPGKVRENPADIVYILGKTQRLEESVYNPTPPRHVRRCLEQIMNWLRDVDFVRMGDAGMGIPLVVRMAIGHSHFEAVHPFSDGNGRVGRMLLSLQMACHGKVPVYLSGFIEEEKPAYGLALQEAQKKLNYAPIVEFFAEALVASAREARNTQEQIENLSPTWMARGKFRKGSTAARALSWLLIHPIFTAKQLQEHFSVSPQAAHIAVELLQAKKIVRERTGFERNRVFAAEEVIALLSRRFGSPPEVALEGALDLMAKAAIPD